MRSTRFAMALGLATTVRTALRVITSTSLITRPSVGSSIARIKAPSVAKAIGMTPYLPATERLIRPAASGSTSNWSRFT